LGRKATDGNGDYTFRKELRITVPVRIAGNPFCKEDEIDALENG